MEFRLLVETSDGGSEKILPLEGRQWVLSPPLDIEDDTRLPPFACVSYRWGMEREPHALVAGAQMSTHTRPALAAAIRAGSHSAFWTDVFCVPQGGPERQSTLENMGYIYSRAAEVIVVLGAETFSVIEEMISHGFVSEQDLQRLEKDEWVSSIWTYQEIVNGGFVRFVSEQKGVTTPSIDCAKFFSALGYSLQKWRSLTSTDTFHTLQTFPNLNALEDTLADWQTADYVRRSAFSVFTSMTSKHNVDPANYYYAILGALTQSPQQLTWDSSQSLDEKVMAICEEKDDFSFIYTVAARNPRSDKPWRPVATPPGGTGGIPDLLRPIFAWHSWGEGQHGQYTVDGLWLHGMTNMNQVSNVSEEGKQSISSWLSRTDLKQADDEVLANTLYAVVESVGFNGCSIPIKVRDGLIFAGWLAEKAAIVRVLVSNQIRWTMGAPGLIHLNVRGEKQYIPCMFVGAVSELFGKGESVLL